MKPLADHGFAPLLHLGIVPANTGRSGGLGQYSAAIMEALTSGGLPAGIGSITILREGSRIPENGAVPLWPTVSLFPPRHPRRFPARTEGPAWSPSCLVGGAAASPGSRPIHFVPRARAF